MKRRQEGRKRLRKEERGMRRSERCKAEEIIK
jgi:hypothetical protein